MGMPRTTDYLRSARQRSAFVQWIDPSRKARRDESIGGWHSGGMTVVVALMEFPALAEWMRVQRASYIADRMRAGDDEAAATRNADAAYDRYFPDGSPAAGHDVLAVLDDGRHVGSLWLGPHPSDLEGVWWVWDVQIDPGERGRGFGRAGGDAARGGARASPRRGGARAERVRL